MGRSQYWGEMIVLWLSLNAETLARRYCLRFITDHFRKNHIAFVPWLCYRLAQGIQQELLADQPPYSFEAEDEWQACESWERRGEE